MSAGITLTNLSVNFDDRFQLTNINWQINPDQHWMITGTNGAGKSALAAVLAGAGSIVSGEVQGIPARVGIVSFEVQAELIAAELKKDDADIMDVIAEGTPVAEILAAVCTDTVLADELVAKFGLTHLLDRAFRKLSTGESRKVMLIRALACHPDLLVLDEPFDGLDVATLAMLQAHLQTLVGKVPMVLVLNRFDEMPDFITHIAYVDKGELQHQVRRDDAQAFAELYQLLHLKTTELAVPAADPVVSLPPLDAEQPLVRLTDIAIKYGDTVIIDGLNWTIQPNQHWQLSSQW